MKDIKFEKRWQAKHPLFRAEAVLNSYSEFKKVPANECKNMLISSEDTTLTAFFDINEMKKAPKIGLRIANDKKAFKKYLQGATKSGKDAVSFSRHLSKSNLNSTNNKKLAKIYKQYFSNFSRIFAYYNLSRPDYTSAIENKLLHLINRKISNQSLKLKIFSQLAAPIHNNLISIHELEQMKMADNFRKRTPNYRNINIEKDEYFKKKINELVERYSWITTQENNPSLNKDYFIKNVKSYLKMSRKEIASKIKKIQERPEKIKVNKNKIINHYKFSRNVIKLSSYLSDLAFLRLNLRLWWTETAFYDKKLFVEINKRLGLGKKRKGNFYYSEFMLKKEINKLLKNNKSINYKIIAKRIKRFTLVMKNKKINLFVRKKADEIDSKYLNNISDITSDIIKGLIANKGLVKGKTWVISPSEKNQVTKANKMPKNYILVTAMTRPQFISAIKKSSAIITDEGGLTSHAAIISREFNVPAIIGTKIATQVLKDGDLVEVDANKGVVKILKN